MDAQLKRGFLDVCVLASINRQDSYGYQIVKDVPSSLHLTESTGLLTVYAIEHNGRLRKYYRITPAGVTYLDEFLKDWDDVLDVYEYVKRGANR